MSNDKRFLSAYHILTTFLPFPSITNSQTQTMYTRSIYIELEYVGATCMPPKPHLSMGKKSDKTVIAQ